jgi:IS4 transposase
MQVLPLESFAVREKGVLKDERVGFVLDEARENYPGDLRRVTYYDEKTEKTYEFLTNNFEFSAKTIADIYRSRWQIELFFKWIKQHMKIKTFLGTSKNAVMTQIWVAMIYYLLLAWIKFQTAFKGSLLDLTRIIGEVLLQNVALIDLLSLKPRSVSRALARAAPQQLSLL